MERNNNSSVKYLNAHNKEQSQRVAERSEPLHPAQSACTLRGGFATVPSQHKLFLFLHIAFCERNLNGKSIIIKNNIAALYWSGHWKWMAESFVFLPYSIRRVVLFWLRLFHLLVVCFQFPRKQVRIFWLHCGLIVWPWVNRNEVLHTHTHTPFVASRCRPRDVVNGKCCTHFGLCCASYVLPCISFDKRT